MKKLSLLFSLTLFTSIASADQCAWNDYTMAAAAREIVKNMAEVNGQEPSVYTYCEPCNDTAMTRVYLTRNEAAVRNQNPYHVNVQRMTSPITPDLATGAAPASSRAGLWQLTVHHDLEAGSLSRFDLAYTYVKITTDRYANLAYVVGCPAEGVTAVIKTNGNGLRNDGLNENGNPLTDDGIPVREYSQDTRRGEG